MHNEWNLIYMCKVMCLILNQGNACTSQGYTFMEIYPLQFFRVLYRRIILVCCLITTSWWREENNSNSFSPKPFSGVSFLCQIFTTRVIWRRNLKNYFPLFQFLRYECICRADWCSSLEFFSSLFGAWNRPERLRNLYHCFR